MNSIPRHFENIFADESDASVTALRARMDEFYATTNSYDAFQFTAQRNDEWCHVRDAIRERLQHRPRCRVLEFGAGKTGFGDYLGDLRPAVEFTVQDVTSANAEFLRTQADHVCIGPIGDLGNSMSSSRLRSRYSDPRATLERLFSMLKCQACCYYSVPAMISPFTSHSADHYTAGYGSIGFKVLARRLDADWRPPAPLIHLIHRLSPAVCDRSRAIHWVSLLDLRALFRNLRPRTLPIRSGGDKAVVL